MKLAVFNDHRIGVVHADRIADVTAALPAWLDALPAQRMNWLISQFDQLKGRIEDLAAAAPTVALSDVTLLAANPSPPHVFAAPANYRKHIGELGDRAVVKKGRSAREQGFFLKAPGSVIGAGASIVLPHGSSRRFDHESELAVIIARGGKDIPRAEAMQHVFGYSCLIDATMRIEPGVAEEERSMRKSFATFTPLGPWIVTADEVPNPGVLRNRLWVDDALKQEANTSEMIVDVAELIELVSSVLPIQPGDVIATGTPEGVGPFVAGNSIRIEIERVGTMTVTVREAARPAPRLF